MSIEVHTAVTEEPSIADKLFSFFTELPFAPVQTNVGIFQNGISTQPDTPPDFTANTKESSWDTGTTSAADWDPVAAFSSAVEAFEAFEAPSKRKSRLLELVIPCLSIRNGQR